MSEKTMECLYYRTLASFLRRSADFKTDYTLFKIHKKEDPESFKCFTKNDLNRINLMDKYYETGCFMCFKENDVVLSNIFPKLEDTKESHYELVKKIYEKREQTLIPYTGGGIEFACPEFPVEFGKIDLVIYNDSVSYAIEVKTNTANHAIVGQVLKYFIWLSLNLSHKFYNDVKLITICPGYDQPAMWGLKQMGVQTLLLDPNTLKTTPIT